MMKKILLLGLLLVFVASISSASRSYSEMEEELRRQCCTVTHFSSSSGIQIDITACAGWFLSDDEKAMERACEKADEASPW